MTAMSTHADVLIIAGSDSSGGAGLSVDLNTCQEFDLDARFCITCVTAQSHHQFFGLEALPPELVRKQLMAATDSEPPRAIKVGMVYRADTIRVITEFLDGLHNIPVVVDPLIRSSSGGRLLEESAWDVFVNDLLPRATVITPNLPEATALIGRTIKTAADKSEAALELARRFHLTCALTGGHDQGDTVEDLLAENEQLLKVLEPKVVVAQARGTGCRFSTAMACGLAIGDSMSAAFHNARDYVRDYIIDRAAGIHPA
jgi:hydroxymethylpyrimidine/phosphomethylpyrimidine kinase